MRHIEAGYKQIGKYYFREFLYRYYDIDCNYVNHTMAGFLCLFSCIGKLLDRISSFVCMEMAQAKREYLSLLI